MEADMNRLNLGMIIEKNSALSDNLNALLAILKNSIPDQGAQVTITVISLPTQNNGINLSDIFPKIFKPKSIGPK
jgi:hypothetical protein